MPSIEKFAKHPESGRTSYLLEIDSLDDWPEEVSLPKAKQFVLFLAADATDVPEEDLTALSTRVLDQGMVYLSTWGKDAERVHDTFEEAAAEWDPDSDADSAILSEWHEGEPLSEALRFAVAHALPAHDFEKGCKATLVAIVGDPDAAELVREWLEDPEKLEKAADDDEKLPPAADEGESADDDEDDDLDDEEDDEVDGDDDDEDDGGDEDGDDD
jgi:hypothetical protein